MQITSSSPSPPELTASIAGSEVVKGSQVAPAELEAVLLKHPEIADAAVIGIAEEEAGELTVAYIVRKTDSAVTEDAIKAHILTHLSQYKVLAEVHFTDEIPKSASGKILQRLLRDTAA